jgi:hypothetical protein
VLAVSAAVVKVPLVGSAPLQPPEAVHAVAFVELHVNVAVLPVATLVGLALKVAVGARGAAAVTVTAVVAAAAVVPTAPLQVSV